VNGSGSGEGSRQVREEEEAETPSRREWVVSRQESGGR